jgi:DNA polymerase-4
VLARKAIGESGAEIYTSYDAKSVSTEHTFFENIDDVSFLEKELLRMTEKLGFELRRDQKSTKCIAVKIRYPDFETHTKQVSLAPTSFDDEIYSTAKQLFHQLYDVRKRIRLLGVRCSELTPSNMQTNLFENTVQKSSLYDAIDQVKNRFGKNALGRGGRVKK